MRNILNFIIVTLIVFQHSSWASDVILPHSPQVIEALVENYNSLSQAERALEMQTFFEQRSSQDNKYLTDNKVDFTTVTWPDLKYVDGVISFQVDEQKIEFKVEQNAILVKGKTIKLADGKINQAVEQLRLALGQKSSSLLDLVIPSAYALFFVPILIAIIAIAIAAYVVFPLLSKAKTAIAKLQCHKMLNEFQNYDNASLSQSDASKILSDVNRVLDKTNSDLSRADCSREPALCKELRDNKKCYELVRTEVEAKSSSVNSSSRSAGSKDQGPSHKRPSYGQPATGH